MAAAASPATTGSPAPAGRLPLTRGRVTALAVGIPVALVIVANTALSLLAPFAEGRYQVTYTAPVSTRTLTMNSSGGQVIAGPTEGAQATLTVVRDGKAIDVKVTLATKAATTPTSDSTTPTDPRQMTPDQLYKWHQEQQQGQGGTGQG